MKLLTCFCISILALFCMSSCSNKDYDDGVSSQDASSSSSLPMLGEDDGEQYFLDEQAILQGDTHEDVSSKILYKSSEIYGVNVDDSHISLPCKLDSISKLGFKPIAPEYGQVSDGINDIVVSSDDVVLHLVVYKDGHNTTFGGMVIGIAVYSSSTDTSAHNISTCGIVLGNDEDILLRKLGSPTSTGVNQYDITGRVYSYVNPDNPSQYFVFTTGDGKVVKIEVSSMEGSGAYGVDKPK